MPVVVRRAFRSTVREGDPREFVMSTHRRASIFGALILITAPVLWATSLRGDTRAPAGSYYVETDLATNPVATNERLINPWGIAWLKDGPFWINENGSGFSSVYFGDWTYYFTVPIPPPPQG